MEALWNLGAFIVALGLLVTIHEFGHFWVARKLGVKVLTFSVGFGKPIYQKIGKDGVRYVIAAIPLGGYVKMLDERESEQDIPEADIESAFNRKSVWSRMAIVLAGPAANFILAIFLYWVMFLIGIKGIIPEIGYVPEASIAAKAGLLEGDRITRVDGEKISVMHELSKNIAKRMGETSDIKLSVVRPGNSREKIVVLDISNWIVDDEKPEILRSLGIYHPLEKQEVIVGELAPDGGAIRAGIEVGDKIVSFEKEPISAWQDLIKLVSSRPEQKVDIEVQRNGELKSFSVVISSSGLIGVGVGSGVDRSKYLVVRKGGVFESFGLAIDETFKMISLTVSLFKKLIVGEISTKSLSGPISIAEGAGNSASIGLVYFISFLAMISVNLGFINLLPVPMLDGGHFLYFLIEAVKGKPLSEKMQEFGLQVGMMMVFALMAIAIFNDISRF